MRRQGLIFLALLSLLAGSYVAGQAAAEWAGCKYLTAGTGVTITCPDTVGRGGATIAAGGASAGGNTTEIQYNASGALAGDAALAWVTLGNGGLTLSLTAGFNSANVVTFKAGSLEPAVFRILSDAGRSFADWQVKDSNNRSVLYVDNSSPALEFGNTATYMFVLGSQIEFRNTTPTIFTTTAYSATAPGLKGGGAGATLAVRTANDTADAPFSALSVEITSGGSTTISTGVGSVKMSTANAATNTSWIPIKYAGNTYFVPGWTTNAP